MKLAKKFWLELERITLGGRKSNIEYFQSRGKQVVVVRLLMLMRCGGRWTWASTRRRPGKLASTHRRLALHSLPASFPTAQYTSPAPAASSMYLAISIDGYFKLSFVRGFLALSAKASGGEGGPRRSTRDGRSQRKKENTGGRRVCSVYVFPLTSFYPFVRES